MDERKETAPIPDQYRELNFYARHYDQRLWMVPGAAYTLSILFYSIIFKTDTLLLGRVVLAVLNAAIFSAFFIQFVKDRCFQLHIQDLLDRFDNFGATVGTRLIQDNDRWFIKFAKQHLRAVNYMFYVMLLTSLLHVFVAGYYLFRIISCRSGVPCS